MKSIQLSLAVLLLLGESMASAQVAAPIPTPLDQWRPVSPGTWKIKALRSSGSSVQQPTTATSLACPYSALLFLRSMADLKLGEAGCRHETYKMSEHIYHIATYCKTLRGKEHVETTTLQVLDNGKRFVAATTWDGPPYSVTLQREGELVSECKSN